MDCNSVWTPLLDDVRSSTSLGSGTQNVQRASSQKEFHLLLPPQDPAAHGVTSPEGVMEPAVFLCDIASLPGADRAFGEANALPRLKELLWLLAPYAELQIIVAECLLCTLHRLVDAHSQYR